MYADIMQVVMLEVFKCSEVEEQQNGHDFTVGQTSRMSDCDALYRYWVKF